MNGTAEMIPQVDQYPAIQAPEIQNTKRPSNGGGRLPWWKDTPTREKYNVFKMLRAEGYSTTKAAEAIGYSPAYGDTIDQKIKDFEARKAASGASVGFLTEKRINRAAVVVDKLMRGVTFGEIKEIKDSTALRAAETVLDRSHPKRPDSDAGPSLSFVTINLGMMAQGLTNTALARPEGKTVEIQAMPEIGPSNPPTAGFSGDGI